LARLRRPFSASPIPLFLPDFLPPPALGWLLAGSTGCNLGKQLACARVYCLFGSTVVWQASRYSRPQHQHRGPSKPGKGQTLVLGANHAPYQPSSTEGVKAGLAGASGWQPRSHSPEEDNVEHVKLTLWSCQKIVKIGA
jgi:hypothetical protein